MWLQQPGTTLDARLVCTLMCTSKRLAAAAAECCGGGGALSVRARVDSSRRAESFAAWLARNGGLLGALQLGNSRHEFSAGSWRGANKHNPTVCILAALPASLSRLALQNFATREPAVSKAQAQALESAFRGQLSGLRALELPDGRQWTKLAADAVLPALTALSRLQSLRIPFPSNAAVCKVKVQQLPGQLQELRLTGSWGAGLARAGAEWLSSLERLSSLTRLEMQNIALYLNTVLPRGVRRLVVRSMVGVKPLQPLAQLTSLCTGVDPFCMHTPAEQLRQLGTLSCLRQLSIELHDSFQRTRSLFALACASFGAVPSLSHLELCNQVLSREGVACLAAATALTCITFDRCTLAADATLTGLAVSLGQLAWLQRVVLDGIGASREESGEAWEDGWTFVMRGLRFPMRLSACDVADAVLNRDAVAHVCRATQLTRLRLQDCDLDDADVLALVSALCGLRELDVSANELLTDACLESIMAAAPRQLTSLRIHGSTQVSDGAAQGLSSALPWMLVKRSAYSRVWCAGKQLDDDAVA